MKKIGRPSHYTVELAAEILERIEAGESLSEICRSEHMPCREVVNRWRHSHESFRLRFACARVSSGDAWADKALEVLDALPVNASAWELRIAEMKSKQFWYWAKMYNPEIYGKPRKAGKVPATGQSIGGIIELISGSTAPLVTLKHEEVLLIG